MLINSNNITINKLKSKLLDDKGVSISMLRLDEIHPVVSGNKLFKLHYFLQEAMQHPGQPIITFGGAYSNHLSATAFAAKLLHIPGLGYVRGEKPPQLSHTLQQCMADNMQLHYLPRDIYRQMAEGGLTHKEGIIIPEGGYHPTGAKGAALIMDLLAEENATHICTAVGTATTLAGLLLGAAAHQKIIAIPVLKGMDDIEQRLEFLTGHHQYDNLEILRNYHFGGYAKKNRALIKFMNDFYEQHAVPTDFVYTAKMMYAVIDSIQNDHFIPGSHIVCVHTGGLQGNRSLPAGTLIF